MGMSIVGLQIAYGGKIVNQPPYHFVLVLILIALGDICGMPLVPISLARILVLKVRPSTPNFLIKLLAMTFN
jgi:hypothetical protein